MSKHGLRCRDSAPVARKIVHPVGMFAVLNFETFGCDPIVTVADLEDIVDEQGTETSRQSIYICTVVPTKEQLRAALASPLSVLLHNHLEPSPVQGRAAFGNEGGDDNGWRRLDSSHGCEDGDSCQIESDDLLVSACCVGDKDVGGSDGVEVLSPCLRLN